MHHSGPGVAGEYLHTLQMIDVNTGWSERITLMGRSYRAMEDAFTRLLARLSVTSILPAQRQEHLERLRDQTNPRRLRQEVYDLLDHLFSLPGNTTDRSEDVLQTLFTHPIPRKGDGIPVTLSSDRIIALR